MMYDQIKAESLPFFIGRNYGEDDCKNVDEKVRVQL